MTILAYFEKDLRVRQDALHFPQWEGYEQDASALQRVLLLITVMIALNPQNNLRCAFDAPSHPMHTNRE